MAFFNHCVLSEGVYMLSWVERKLAATLFATPPESTVEDALKYFEKAEEVNPGFYKANQLYIAKVGPDYFGSNFLKSCTPKRFQIYS